MEGRGNTDVPWEFQNKGISKRWRQYESMFSLFNHWIVCIDPDRCIGTPTMLTAVAGILQLVRVLPAEGKPGGVVVSPSTEEPVRLHLLIRSWSQVHVKHLRGGHRRGRGLVHHRRHLEKNDDSMPNQCHFFMSAIFAQNQNQNYFIDPREGKWGPQLLLLEQKCHSTERL